MIFKWNVPYFFDISMAFYFCSSHTWAGALYWRTLSGWKCSCAATITDRAKRSWCFARFPSCGAASHCWSSTALALQKIGIFAMKGWGSSPREMQIISDCSSSLPSITKRLPHYSTWRKTWLFLQQVISIKLYIFL